MDKTPEKDDIFEFPCQFPIKVMGKSVDHFKSLIVDIVRHHTTEIEKVSMRTSSGGKYSAVTVSITATSRQQLDALYIELSQHALVNMVL